MQSIPASRTRLWLSGKMPTTPVRRPIALLKRSSGFVDLSLRAWPGGNAPKPRRICSSKETPPRLLVDDRINANAGADPVPCSERVYSGDSGERDATDS
jgi:hypothetical protein